MTPDQVITQPSGCPRQDVSLIEPFFDESSDNNVFLIGNSLVGTSKIEGIYLGNCELVCIDTLNSKLSIKLDGLGDKALIKNA